MSSAISLDLNQIPQLGKYIENTNEEELNELVKESLIKHFENGAKNEETKVDKWIKLLNELVEWANAESDKME